jgi:hypothetical protein
MNHFKWFPTRKWYTKWYRGEHASSRDLGRVGTTCTTSRELYLSMDRRTVTPVRQRKATLSKKVVQVVPVVPDADGPSHRADLRDTGRAPLSRAVPLRVGQPAHLPPKPVRPLPLLPRSFDPFGNGGISNRRTQVMRFGERHALDIRVPTPSVDHGIGCSVELASVGSRDAAA